MTRRPAGLPEGRSALREPRPRRPDHRQRPAPATPRSPPAGPRLPDRPGAARRRVPGCHAPPRTRHALSLQHLVLHPRQSTQGPRSPAHRAGPSPATAPRFLARPVADRAADRWRRSVPTRRSPRSQQAARRPCTNHSASTHHCFPNHTTPARARRLLSQAHREAHRPDPHPPWALTMPPSPPADSDRPRRPVAAHHRPRDRSPSQPAPTANLHGSAGILRLARCQCQGPRARARRGAAARAIRRRRSARHAGLPTCRRTRNRWTPRPGWQGWRSRRVGAGPGCRAMGTAGPS